MSEVRRFKRPTHTQMPNEILDELMAELTGAEFKVLCYIARRTFGFQHFDEYQEPISTRQLMHGFRSKDGYVYDRGTGLSNRSIIDAIRTLEEKNFIVVTRSEKKGPKGFETSTYRILLEDEIPLDSTPNLPKTPYEKSSQAPYELSAPPLVNFSHKLNKEGNKASGNKAAASGERGDLEKLVAAAEAAAATHIGPVGMRTAKRIVAAAIAHMPDISAEELTRVIHQSVPPGKRLHGAGFFVTVVGDLLESKRFQEILRVVETRKPAAKVQRCAKCNGTGIVGASEGGTMGHFKALLAAGGKPCSCREGQFYVQWLEQETA